ncbi:MAG: hypothetical protein C0606_08460 [Hyphomicrobiales bacterium]|nr:MAG: hypothetical protein C0606_08460 [Hyphomicrobiales bacterium]
MATNGTSGADTLNGTSGADTISGLSGNDTIKGYAGADSLEGNQGDDIIAGGDGNDTIRGGDDNDSIAGGNGNDTIFGGDGNDTVAGNVGDDEISGGAGQDTLRGWDGNDWVDGDGGADQVYGDAGDDTLIGGAGNDTLYGGNGIDWAYYTDASGGVTVNLEDGTATGQGSDSLFGIENVKGGAGDDEITGTSAANHLLGNDGDDSLNGGGGNDSIRGGTGNDLVVGGGGNDSIYGDADNDTLIGGAGDDFIYGGNGTDWAYYTDASGGVLVDLEEGTAAGQGSDSLFGIENVKGGAGDDEIIGSSDANRLVGDNGDDKLSGGDGNDTLSGGAGNDTLYGNVHHDTLYGGGGGDLLNGGVGNDSVNGDGGDDTLIGGTGDDTLDGGDGVDWAYYSAASSGVTVNLVEGTAAGIGSDSLVSIENIKGGASDDEITGSAAANYLVGDDGNDTLSGNGGNDTLSGGAGSDSLKGGGDDDFLSGQGDDDWLFGGDGDDTVSGDAGNDTLHGGNGNDTLGGGADDDFVNGGDGNDVISGDSGVDTLMGGDGNDTMDGGDGVDWASYTNATSGVTVNLELGTATGHGSDVLSNIENVKGSDSNDAITGSSDANYLEGRGGSDTLIGGGGNDTLSGGDGVDTAVFTGDWADYDVTVNGDSSYTLVDTRGGSPDGTTTVLADVENFQFSDGTVARADVPNDAPSDITLSNDTILENAQPGDVVGTVAVSDADSGIASEGHSYQITGGTGAGLFDIDGSTGAITVAGALDYETTNTYDLSVDVTDAHGATYTETVTISVGDVNEAPDSLGIAFNADVVTNNGLDENTALGTVVGTATGSDPDAGDVLSYSLTDDAGGAFAIDGTTGVITVAGALNHEATETLDLTVRVTDTGGLTRDETVTLEIRDIDEVPDSLAVSVNAIDENSEVGTVVGTATGSDPDAGDVLSYSLTDDANGAFAIDSVTGVITVADPLQLDYETAQTLDITVRVTDAEGLYIEANQAVTLNNVIPETITGSSGDDSITGADGNDTLIGGGGNDTLSGGDGVDTAVFTGTWADYDVTVNGDSSYLLVDTRGGSPDGTTTVLANVENFQFSDGTVARVDVPNDVPSDITLSNNTILENAQPGDVVGTVAVSDADSAIASETHSFQFTENTDSGPFAIDGATGVITVAGALDYETTNTYDLSVDVTDAHGATYTETVTISVGDVNEAGAYPAELSLSSLDGTNGFQINGEAAEDYSGYSVSSAGDINGDGFDDVIIGAFRADPNGSESGASYVVFGKATGYSASIELSNLDGTDGFQINGEAVGDRSGWSVSNACDVNGDGYDDLIIGAYFADPNGNTSGASYVVFGKATGYSASIELSNLDGTDGFQINGEAASDLNGDSVSSAGDINGDGFDDLIVGAFGADPNGDASGASYVVFGKASGFAANLELSSLDGANGFQINGETVDDNSGHSVSSAGDINGDGFDDLIVGAPYADPNGVASGASYVVFGKASGFAANLELSSLDGTNGFQINGGAADDRSGWSVSSAGDINGDGFDDLILGADFADPNGDLSGASYVVFGQASGFAASLELSSLDGTNGFQINGEATGDQSGHSVSSAGDVDGDGYDDLIIGSFGADPNGDLSGASYVVFGKASGFTANLELSSLGGINGFQINGEAAGDQSGVSVSGAGDVNGDGFDDLIIGASHADPNGDGSGASYVVFGGPGAVDPIIGGDTDDSLIGGEGDDYIDGGDGRDEILGNGGDDTLIGGSGKDTIYGGTGADSIDGEEHGDEVYGEEGDDTITGGHGYDTLDGGAGNDFIDGGEFDDSVLGGDGNDTLWGGDGNDTVNGGTGNDVLYGNAGDDWLNAAGGNDTIYHFVGDGDDQVDGRNDDDLLIVANHTLYADGSTAANASSQTFAVEGFINGEIYIDYDGLDAPDVSVLKNTEVIEIVLGDGGDAVELSGDFSLTDLTGGITVNGGNGDDLLIVNLDAAGHVFAGGAGEDTLDYSKQTAAVTADLAAGTGTGMALIINVENLTGGAGDDTLSGDNGDNRLAGGLGDDSLTGVLGSDSFVYADGAFGHDTLTDFQTGAASDDVIEFSTDVFADYAAVLAAATDDGTDTTITFDADNTIVLEDVLVADLDSDDFVFV